MYWEKNKNSKSKGKLINFAQKIAQERILIIVLKVKAVSANSKTTEKVFIFVRNIKGDKWNLPNKIFLNVPF